MFQDPRGRRRLHVVQRARDDRQLLELRAVADGLEVRIALRDVVAVRGRLAASGLVTKSSYGSSWYEGAM